jgi:hypothetical protein
MQAVETFKLLLFSSTCCDRQASAVMIDCFCSQQENTSGHMKSEPRPREVHARQTEFTSQSVCKYPNPTSLLFPTSATLFCVASTARIKSSLHLCPYARTHSAQVQCSNDLPCLRPALLSAWLAWHGKAMTTVSRVYYRILSLAVGCLADPLVKNTPPRHAECA